MCWLMLRFEPFFGIEIRWRFSRTINFKICLIINHSRGISQNILKLAARTASENSPSGSIHSCTTITTWNWCHAAMKNIFTKNCLDNESESDTRTRSNVLISPLSAVRNYVKGLKIRDAVNGVMKEQWNWNIRSCLVFFCWVLAEF